MSIQKIVQKLLYNSEEKHQTKRSLILTQGALPYLKVTMVSPAPKQHRIEKTVRILFWSFWATKSQKIISNDCDTAGSEQQLTIMRMIMSPLDPNTSTRHEQCTPTGLIVPHTAELFSARNGFRAESQCFNLKYLEFFVASNMAPDCCRYL